MKALLMSLTMSLGLLVAGTGHAQAPAAAPAGSTGLCKDGSYTTGATKRGACRGHQGVKDWYAGDTAAPAAAGAGAAMAAPKATAPSKAGTAAATAARTAAPAGSTGLCKDGSYYSGESKRGACRGHKGVKEWYGAPAGAGTAAATTGAASMPATPPAAATPKMPAPATPAAVPNRNSTAPADEPESRAAAPGGGAGKVWVNSESKVYHCQDDRYYGKTKQGEYMSEADAITKGNRASHGKSCAK